MSEAAGAAFGVGELLHLDDLGLLVAGYHHLGNALAVVDDEVLLREVYQYHANLAAVVGVNGARTVEDGDALLQRQAAAGAHLGFVACGQLHEETCLDEASLQGFQRNGPFRQEGPQIHACRLRSLVFRQRVVGGVSYFYLHNCIIGGVKEVKGRYRFARS